MRRHLDYPSSFQGLQIYPKLWLARLQQHPIVYGRLQYRLQVLSLAVLVKILWVVL